MPLEKLKKGDFIEIDFTGKVKGGEVFDSTKKEELEKLHTGHDYKISAKPFVFCLGHGMFMKALDDFLIGKEIGKEFCVELSPEESFGKRNLSFISKIPSRIFKEQKLNPLPGISLNFDGRIGKVLAISGGRVMVDFNHPLSGKEVVYKIKIIKKIEDTNEKVKALNDFFFKKDFEFRIDNQNKKISMEVDKPFIKMVELFKDRFKEMLGLELELKEAIIKEKKVKKKEEDN